MASPFGGWAGFRAHGRRLGRELDLFSFHPEAPASPFFHPRGAIVYNQLLELMREKYRVYGYDEVITPQVFGVELWKQSGHYDAYRDDMFFADGIDEIEDPSYSVKPMNCPSHCLIYGAGAHSYRDLPRRIADFGRLHRFERSGVVTGLTMKIEVRPVTTRSEELFFPILNSFFLISSSPSPPAR